MTVAKKKRGTSAALAIANEINNELKLDSPMRLGSDPYFTIVRIPTGSLVVDRITGGGFALGRHYELFGDESVGKSYICYRTMALAQQRGKLCAVIDPEHAFDAERFHFLGGDPEELLALHPRTGEDAVATMMMLAGHPDLKLLEVITCDSVSSLVSLDEHKKDPREQDRLAAQARMMSKALRRITAVNNKTLFLWTNQERMNVGVAFGNPRVTSGGRALRYYATGRIEFRRGTKVIAKRKRAKAGKLMESEVQVGRWIQCRVEKDKSTRPGREGSFVFDYEEKRISLASEIVQLGLEDGLIERSANGRYSYEDIDGNLWSGTERQFHGYLRKNDELRDELVSAIEDVTMNQEGVNVG